MKIRIDGEAVEVTTEMTVAAALLHSGREVRGPLCGMGTCFGCRVTIDGRPYQRACRVFCRDGLDVETRRA